jgi:Flp pilus assembly protein protease CpaA
LNLVVIAYAKDLSSTKIQNRYIVLLVAFIAVTLGRAAFATNNNGTDGVYIEDASK